MEKLCNRCQFRTPQTRAICHVCGHNHFTQIDNSNTSRYTVDTPIKNIEDQFDTHTLAITEAFKNIGNTIMSALRAPFASALSSVRFNAMTPQPATEEPFQTASKLLQNRLPKTVNRPSIEPATEPTPAAKSTQVAVSQIAAPAFSTANRYEFSGNGTVVDLLSSNMDLSSTSTETRAQMDELNRLLQWFRACGTENLVLPSGTSRQFTEDQSTDNTINLAA